MLIINATITNHKTVDFLQEKCKNDCTKCRYLYLCGIFSPNSGKAKEMIDNAIEFSGCENEIIACKRIKE